MIANADFKIAVIGAGPAGIACARELLRRGFGNVTIFEATDAVGGTWHIHSYPGLACDVWAHSYTFSGAPNPDWSASFVGQPEIERYLQRCAHEFGLDDHIRLNSRLTQVAWQPDGRWRLCTADGEVGLYDVVINAMGNQHTPLWPELPGLETFSGDYWHATRWNHAVDLRGKRVAVVGSAASAVQIVPEVAQLAGQLYVLQRTPNWIMPRGCKPYGKLAHWAFRRLPWTMKAVQGVQRALMGMMHQGALLGHKRQQLFEKMARQHIERMIPDPELRRALTPDTRFGCKRPLVSDDFYPALLRDNVTLVAAGAERVTPTGIVTADGRELQVDVIIYCTGYKVLDFDRIEVLGPGGRSLAAVMAESPQAYKGIAVQGFPNYFFAVGPNGVVLSVSYFLSAETNAQAIAGLLEQMASAGVRQVSPRAERHRAYNDWLRDECARFSWGSAECHSYYRTDSGHSPFLYPGDFRAFKRQQGSISLDEFEVFAPAH